MIPPLIVREALEHEINLIAITDHNACENVKAVQKAASGSGLVIMPGMELQTKEDIHSICLFDRFEQVEALQAMVKKHLPRIKNNPDFFGEQYIVDETGNLIRSEEQLLILSTDLSLTEAWQYVNELGGLFIPAHVDRKAFGLFSSLGMIPTDFPIDALEISRFINPDKALKTFPQLSGYPLIQNGDVHGLAEFLGSTTYYLAEPTINELRKAFLGVDGRNFSIVG